MVENTIQYEVELVERLWSQGWAAFRTASQGPGGLANCDIVASKSGSTYFLNVVVMEYPTSKTKVFDEKEDLKKVARRAKTNVLDKTDGMNFGHAVKKVYSDSWDFADAQSRTIADGDELPSLNEEMNQ